ncbi:methyltransferase domain-containing protein [Streptomyces orinoci]|uniref:Methyltransferase domain-containing protein n=1 Tax=Streptomyces orinoci TaxID=67339 RepID=A0ABV3JYR8_STRON|nr:methyltransferase domain-containing protein [Streptomyces orinoci]
MADRYVPHAFSDIDSHPDPARLVAALNRLSAHPFFAAYRQRAGELLGARRGSRLLEVGAGTGEAARRLAAQTGAEITVCDLSAVMCGEMRGCGLTRVAVADAGQLPFRDRIFDGVWADRVLQHVSDPERALAEMVRVVRPGGRIVVCDPDTGTQALELADQRLAARVLELRRTVNIRHGTFARRTPGLLAGHGLADVRVEARTLVIRDAREVGGAMGIRDWAEVYARRGYLSRPEADRFNALLGEAIESGRFLFAVTYFLTSGTV